MFDVKNIKRYYLQASQRIRNFLLSSNCREFLVFLFFVFVAFCFWLLMILNDTYQTEFKIPLRLKNVPKEVVVTSGLPTEVRVEIEDRGTILLNYMLGRTFFPLAVDFEDYADKGNHVVIPKNDISRKVAAQLNASTKMLSVRPDTIDYIYTEGIAKTVPVIINKNVTAGRQYFVSEVRCTPDSVTVYAPEDALKNIVAAYTQPIELQDVTDTIVMNALLQTTRGVKFVPSSVKVSVYVDMYSEKTVEVPIQGFDFPKGKVLRTFPSRVQVTFQVGLQHFSSVTGSDFLLGVSYPELMNEQGDKAKVILRGIPESATHVRISPSTVDYLIEEQTVFQDSTQRHD